MSRRAPPVVALAIVVLAIGLVGDASARWVRSGKIEVGRGAGGVRLDMAR